LKVGIQVNGERRLLIEDVDSKGIILDSSGNEICLKLRDFIICKISFKFELSFLYIFKIKSTKIIFIGIINELEFQLPLFHQKRIGSELVLV